MDFKKYSSYLLPLIPIILFFLLWEILADLDIINFALFSKPSFVISQLFQIGSQLPNHFASTLYRLVVSFFLALIIGIAVGTAMGYKRIVYRFFNPLITMIMTIPGIAMVPIFIVWLGFGDPTIIFIGVIVAFFPIVYNTAMGVRSVDPQLIRAAKIMGANSKNIFLNVYLPHSAPYLIIGSKLGLARCWRTVIAVEFIAATNYGLGYMIWDAYEYLRVAIVYGGIILLAVTFFIIERTIIKKIEISTIEKWGMIQKNE